MALNVAEYGKSIYLKYRHYKHCRQYPGEVCRRTDQNTYRGNRPDRSGGRKSFDNALLPLKDDSCPEEADSRRHPLNDAIPRDREAVDPHRGKGGGTQRNQSEGTKASRLPSILSLEADNES